MPRKDSTEKALRLLAKGDLGEFDLAAGVREDLLNDFSRAHHKREFKKRFNPYVGMDDLADLRIRYSYKIPQPAQFDLAPFKTAKQSYRRWLMIQPEVVGLMKAGKKSERDQIRGLVDEDVPTVRVRVPAIEIALKVLPNGVSVKFQYAFTVLAIVQFTEGRIEFVPIDAWVEDPSQLEREISRAIRQSGAPVGHSEETCYELQELMKHVINRLLSMRLSSFVGFINVPTAIGLFAGVEITPLLLKVMDDFLVVTATATLTHTSLHGLADLGSDAFTDPASAKDAADVLAAATDQRLATLGRPSSIRSLKELAGSRRRLIPKKGLFLFITARLLQLLANKTLQFDEKGGSCKRWGPIEGCYNWFVRLWDPRTTIKNDRVNVDIELQAGGGVRARVHTHCGPLPWIGAGVKGDAVPQARLNAGLYFQDRALWISAGSRPFLIVWRGSGGWPVSEIIATILNLLGNATLLIVSLIGARWTRKMVELPDQFPGTDFDYVPKLDRNVVNVDGHLAVLGTVDFLPN